MKTVIQNPEVSEERERDIQAVCDHIITKGIQSTGDHGSGGECPFCYRDCLWDANDLSEIEHENNCIYLIAKDLSTNFRNNS